MKKAVSIVLLAVLSFCLILLAACGGDTGEKSIKNLTYNGEAITWSSVKGAKQYKIKIADGADLIVSQAEGTVSYLYDSKGEDFNFSVEAVIKDGSDKNPRFSLTFTNIGQVQNLKVKDDKLVWDTLTDSDSYQIMYNGKIESQTVGVNEYPLKVGVFKYKVRALKGNSEAVDGNNKYYSVWSQPLDGTVLSAPTEITYDSETFRWTAVKDAVSYQIKIGTEEFTSTENSFVYAAGTKDFNISIRAMGNPADGLYNSAYGEEMSYTYLKKITSINVDSGTLVWDAVENAAKYKIKIGGITENQLLTTNRYDKLQSGTSYRIQVLPIGTSDFYFSQWSTEITVNILRAPAVSFGDNVIRWDEVSGSSGYEVVIEKGGETLKTDSVNSESRIYNYSFDEAGEYSVKVKALSLTGGGIYESKYSVPFRVKRLASPTEVVVTNQPLEQKQVSVSFNPVAESSGYKLKANGAEISDITEGSSFAVDISIMTSEIAESTVNFEVLAKGSITATAAILDSSASTVSVTKLATPQNVSISGRVVSWDNVSHTSKYVVTVNGKRTEITTNSYTFTDLAAGDIAVYVQAMGNAQNIVTSGYSNVINARKLAKPTNLTLNANGLLSWDVVNGATSYSVSIGQQKLTPDTNSVNINSHLSNIIEGQGVQISVYAQGNSETIIDSDSSDTKTLSRYTRPTAVQLSGDNLVWQGAAVNGIPAKNYLLYIDQNQPITLQATSYALTNFTAGTHTVKVVTVGNRVDTIDSPQSDTFTFTKRGEIENLVRVDGKYTWDAVSGASYEVTFGDATPVITAEAQLTVPFVKAGQYAVKIKVLGNDADIADSDTTTFQQKVSAITTPVRDSDFRLVKDGNKVTITITGEQNVAGYQFIVSGVVNEQTEKTFEYTMTTAGATYLFKVVFVGQKFIGDVLFINSNPSAEITITND